MTVTLSGVLISPSTGFELGPIIRFHRKQAGLTQLQLAEMAGVGKSTVFDVEKGKHTVQLDKLEQILEVLNIQILFSSSLMEKYEKI